MQVGGVVGQHESVHDLAQSVCREVLEDLDELEGMSEESFRQWLFMQARRKVLDRHRYLTRARRDVGREVAPGSDDEAGSLLDCYATFCTPSRIAGARDELQRVEAAIAQLPDDQREAVAMSRIMELDYPEIAQRLGRTESAARGLVARGLAQLALLLN
jgi:RNA polymerase sigma-70 factor (ECF subfamily)